MYVCICNQITDKDIEKAVQSGAHNMASLCQQLPVGNNCGKCCQCACEVLEQSLAKQAATHQSNHLTNCPVELVTA